MDKTKNAVSPAQKKAQKKYDQKTKTISIKYTPHDMEDLEQLQKYLERTNQSINGFIKRLIKSFFIEGHDKESPQIKDPVEKKREQEVSYYPFLYIAEDNIQVLVNLLGEKLAIRFLDEYYSFIESDVEEILEERSYTFDEWITEIEEEIVNGEINYGTDEELYKILRNRLGEGF